jgi:hypothetical protein
VYTIAAGQEGAVAFTSVVAAGAGPGAALSLGAVRVTGQCTILASGGSGLCGISFGPNGTTNFRIPGGAAFGSYDRWVKHTFNIATTPEPGTALLLGLGVGGLALLRRRAPRS